MNEFDWAEEMNCAVTVCDNDGVIVYQNKPARGLYTLLLAAACWQNLFVPQQALAGHNTPYARHRESNSLAD